MEPGTFCSGGVEARPGCPIRRRKAMPEAPLVPGSPLQRQIAQLALELAAQLEQTAQPAPGGSVLEGCEALLLGAGRQFLRDTLAATLQQQIDQAEKRGGRRATALVATPAATKAQAPVSSSPPSAPS